MPERTRFILVDHASGTVIQTIVAPPELYPTSYFHFREIQRAWASYPQPLRVAEILSRSNLAFVDNGPLFGCPFTAEKRCEYEN